MAELVEHLSEENYDNIIVTNFEADQYLDNEQLDLIDFNPEVYDYMYGWERSEVEEWGYKEGKDFCEGGTHSEVVLLYDWMKELEGDIFLCGVFDNECIEDMEYALTGSGKTFKRIENLII